MAIGYRARGRLKRSDTEFILMRLFKRLKIKSYRVNMPSYTSSLFHFTKDPGYGGTLGMPGLCGKPGRPGFEGESGRSGYGGWSDELLEDYIEE